MNDLRKIVNLLKKKYSSVRIAGEVEDPHEYISTGNYALDLSLDGGISWGYATEWSGGSGSGKTLMLQMMLAYAQEKYNAIGIWFDREKAFFNDRSAQLNIDLNRTIVIDPIDIPTAKDAEIIAKEILSNMDKDVYKFIVIDSISAFDKDGDKADMGKKAKSLHELFRTILPFLTPKSSLNFSNQRTFKVGVLFGCLHADCKVPLVDGRSLSIREIVDNKIEGEVFCIDENTNKIERSKIIDWHYNGDIKHKDNFITLKANGIDTINGVMSITCTKDHEILTDGGWKKAEHLQLGDKVISKYKSILNGTLGEFLIGSMIGDSSIISHGRSATLRFSNSKNIEYNLWKMKKLKYLEPKIINTVHSKHTFYIKSTYEFFKIKSKLDNRNPLYFYNDITWLTLAIWWMDDGHCDLSGSHKRGILSLKRFAGNVKLLDSIKVFIFIDKFNINPHIDYKTGAFSFNKDDFEIICENICEFIPSCMQYKLLPSHRSKYKEFDLDYEIRYLKDTVNITSISQGSTRKFRQRGRYDISIEDNKNYLVGNINNGIIVHNSPETTTGGEGPKYYCTYRIKLDDRKSIIDTDKGNENIGNWIHAEVVKTRRGPNYRTIMFPFFYKTGIEHYGGYARLLADRGFLVPTNKSEFKSFKTHTLTFGEGDNIEKVNEFKIEKFLEKHPEYLFTEYPEYKGGNSGDITADTDSSTPGTVEI